MVKKVAFNTDVSPVVVSADGRTIAGLDRGEVDTTDDAVRQALGAGRLVWPEEFKPGAKAKGGV